MVFLYIISMRLIFSFWIYFHLSIACNVSRLDMLCVPIFKYLMDFYDFSKIAVCETRKIKLTETNFILLQRNQSVSGAWRLEFLFFLVTIFVLLLLSLFFLHSPSFHFFRKHVNVCMVQCIYFMLSFLVFLSLFTVFRCLCI